MGHYKRPDSPFWWMLLERPGQRAIRESTQIPVKGGTWQQSRANRDLARNVYWIRRGELLRARIAADAARRPQERSGRREG